jgi:predicted PurR-regulated permease PerM
MDTLLTSVIKKILFTFLVFSGLYLAKDFLMPLCIGGILATLFLPFCNWMERKKVSKVVAVLVCLLLLLTIIIGFFTLLGWKIIELASDLALIKEKAIETGRSIQEYLFSNLNITIEEQYQILKNEQPSYSNVMQTLLGSVAYVFTTLLLVMIYFLFLLYYRNHIRNFIIKLSGTYQQSEIKEIILSVTKISQQYLLGLSKMIVLLWIMYGIGFSAIGVENALFFAILCGLLEIVPYVGNITGTLLTVLVAAIHGANPSLLGSIVAIYVGVQLIQGWVLEPLILGPQVKINSLFTIIALVLGELLWGIPGIILAIPLLAMVKIICDHVDPLKPYGFLIGEIKTKKEELKVIKIIKKQVFKK